MYAEQAIAMITGGASGLGISYGQTLCYRWIYHHHHR